MKFHYKKYSSTVFRPVIPIEIKHKGKSVIYEVLLDSGADSCIFHAEIADILGLELNRGRLEDVAGITGVKQPYYIHSVKLKVGDKTYDTEAGFMPNMPAMGYGVVGQIGFFDKFKISFNYKHKTIFLK